MEKSQVRITVFNPAAAVLMPVIMVVAAVAASVTVMAIAGVVLLPNATLTDLLKASRYLSVLWSNASYAYATALRSS